VDLWRGEGEGEVGLEWDKERLTKNSEKKEKHRLFCRLVV